MIDLTASMSRVAKPVSVLSVAVALASTLLTAETGSAQSKPELFSFAVDGRVRDAKTECTVDACTTYALVRVPQDGKADRGERADAGSAARRDAEDPRDVELWALVVPTRSQSTVSASMRRLRSSVPADADRLAFCESGPVESLIMLQALGSVFFVDPSSADQALAPGTRVGSAKWAAPATPWAADCSELMLVGPGAVRQVKLAGRGARRSVLSATEFPIDFSIRRNGSGLTLESPPVRRIDEVSGRVAVGPQIYGDLRIESLVFEPSAGSAQWLQGLSGSSESAAEAGSLANGVLRSWSRLPAAEEILQSHYLSMGGTLVLAVVTKEADKVGILERKKLRLFRLAADRTRAGKLPFFEVLTSSRLWQRLDIQFLDVTQDGIDDLVLVQPDGLNGEPTLVDVYRATAPLTFSSKKARTILETGTAWWSLENDWNGDGDEDVVVLDGQVLQFHDARWSSGETGKRKKRQGYWSTEPSYRLNLVRDASALGDTSPAEGSRSGDEDDDAPNKMIASILQKVWVDDGVMVIPTVFERASRQSEQDAELIEVGSAEEEEQQQRDEARAESGEGRDQGVIFVVRSVRAASEQAP